MLLLVISIYNISSNKIDKLIYFIFLILFQIKYYPFSILFISDISFSYSNNDNRKNVNPAENISLFSGLNYPNPDFI